MIIRHLKIVLLITLFVLLRGGVVHSYQTVPDTLLINDLLDQAVENIHSGDFAEAREKVSMARERSEELDYQSGIEQSIIRMADIYLNEQFYDSAEVILKDGIERYPESSMKSFYQNLLATTFRYQNKLDEAIELYERILAETDSTPANVQRIAAIRLNLATAYDNMGNRTEAIRNFLAGIEYAESAQDTQYWVVALNNLGDTYNGYEEYERAEFYLQKSIQLSRDKGLKSNLLRSLMNLANTRTNTQDSEEALALYEEALSLHNEIRPNTPPFQILYNMGNLFLQTGDLVKAEENFNESLRYCRQFGIPQGIYFNTTGLGNLEYARGDLNAAREWFLQAATIAKEMNASGFMMESYEKLYDLNKRSQNYEQALVQLENYHQLSDSLRNLEQEKEFAELESKLEIIRQEEINSLLREKQQQQERQLRFQFAIILAGLLVIILILYILYKANKENALKAETNNRLREQQHELEKMNTELNQLFAIIAHDLKSPMSTIQGLLYLYRSDELKREEIHEFFGELEKATDRNLTVMEDLFSWAQGRMKGIQMDLEAVDLGPLIEKVIENQRIEARAKELEIVSHITNDQRSVHASAKALSMVFRNLLSNSIKFTDTGGKITFSGTEFEDKVEICISDTGVGMSEEIRTKVMGDLSYSFTKQGTKGEKGTGFGLSLVKEFVHKMKGTIEVESEEGKGTTFCISLPVYPHQA